MTPPTALEDRLRRDLAELAAIPRAGATLHRVDERRRRPVVAAALAAAVVVVLLAAAFAVARVASRGASPVHPAHGTTPIPRPGPTTSYTGPITVTGPTVPSGSASTATTTGVSLQSVQWASIGYPLHCGNRFQPTFTVQQVAFANPAPGAQIAVVLVRCNSGAGTPSSALLVYDGATSPSTPHLAATLVAATDGWQTALFSANGTTLTLPANGFSSNTVANCCPDVHTTLTWSWTATGYVLTSTVPPHVTYPQ